MHSDNQVGNRLKVPVVVHIIVKDSADRILLMQRANTGFMDGYYAFPGGHVKDGETVVQAARRECYEESGLIVQSLQPSSVMPYDGGIDFLFRAEGWRGEPVINEPDKCSSYGWFREDGLPENTVAFVRKALELDSSGNWFHEYDV